MILLLYILSTSTDFLSQTRILFVLVRKDLEEWMVVGQVCNQGYQKGLCGSGPAEESGLDLEWSWERHEKWRLRTHVGDRA